MHDQRDAIPISKPGRTPWNKEKRPGAQPPLRSKHVVDPDQTIARRTNARNSADFPPPIFRLFSQTGLWTQR